MDAWSDSSDSEVSPRPPVVLTDVQKAFDNAGLKNWHQQRAEWTAPPESGATKVAGSEARAAGREVDPQLLFDCFRDMKKFPHGVPLSVMVEFLDMVWEEEN